MLSPPLLLCITDSAALRDARSARLAVEEQVRQQRRTGLHGIAIQVGHAGFGQHP